MLIHLASLLTGPALDRRWGDGGTRSMARSVSLFAERAVARGHAASPARTRGMSAESSAFP